MADENVGLSGGLYAHASAVTNEAGNLVADFRGGWTAEVATTQAEWFGQHQVRQGVVVTQKDIVITVNEVAFKPALLETLWGCTSNAADNLKSAGAEAATSYTFDDDTEIPTMEYLVECQLGGKTFQAYAPSAICLGAPLNLTKDDYVVFNVQLLLFNASGSLVEFLNEN